MGYRRGVAALTIAITTTVLVGCGARTEVAPTGEAAAPTTTERAPDQRDGTPRATPGSPATVTTTTSATTTSEVTTTVAPPPAPTTTTTVATTTTTEPPPPAPSTVEAASLPSTVDPGTGDPLARARAAFAAGVPSRWWDTVSSFDTISGTSSFTYPNGRIEIGSYHTSGGWERLKAVVAHEVGHAIAFRYGTGEYPGAPPAGFPVGGARVEERWADCVAVVFTGIQLNAHGLPPCPTEAVMFTADWLATH